MRDLGSIPGLGRSPGGGHGNPLHYSILENSEDRGAWQATVHEVGKSRTRMSDFQIRNIIAIFLKLSVPILLPAPLPGAGTNVKQVRHQ